MTLGGRLTEHRASFLASLQPAAAGQPQQPPQEHSRPAGAVDEWFMDDGQAFVQPRLATRWLQSVDRAIAAFGGARARGEDCKSVARLLCPPQRRAEFPGWAAGHIAETCRVLDPAIVPKVLGAHLGDTGAVTADFQRVTAKVEGVRSAVRELNHPPCELTLHRRCLDVSKAAYLLRCNGDRVQEAALDAFDTATRGGIEEVLAGTVSDEAWVQATLGVDAGGLGMRDASLVALPAFIASRVTSRPLVAEMASHLEEAGLCAAAVCMQAYDHRSQQALHRWLAALPAPVQQDAQSHMADAAAAAAHRWQSWCAGEAEQPEDPDLEFGPRARGSRRPGAGLVPDAGTEDPEHPASPASAGALRLQRQLVRLVDACAARGLLDRARRAGDWERELLLAELVSPNVSHEWLWSLDAHKGDALAVDDYVAAVRLRLGAAGPPEEVPCANCGNNLLGPVGTHALLCAPGPSTRGHNAVRNELFAVASTLDSTSELEPVGLIPSRPGLRPADLFTGASGFSGRLAALDVGICCPAAAGAGEDCVESMRRRKVARIAPFASELEAGGIEYRPIVFSCYGRPHPDAQRLVQSLARRLARRRGTEAHIEERRLAARIGLQIWRRAARMLRHCLPDTAELAAELERDAAPIEPAVQWRVGHPASVEPEAVPPAATGG